MLRLSASRLVDEGLLRKLSRALADLSSVMGFVRRTSIAGAPNSRVGSTVGSVASAVSPPACTFLAMSTPLHPLSLSPLGDFALGCPPLLSPSPLSFYTPTNTLELFLHVKSIGSVLFCCTSAQRVRVPG
jgi:hypothetical protein